jgi:hypothetical protein
MKKTHLVRALVLASLAVAAKGYSQTTTVVPGSVSKVNFALTVSTSANALKGAEGPSVTTEKTNGKGVVTSTYQYGTKIVTAKYSSKELITDLLALENMTDPSVIKGWYIEKVQVTTNGEGNPDIGTSLFFLSKKGENSIALGNRISLGSSLKVSGRSIKQITVKTPVVPATDPVTYTDVVGKPTYSEALKFAGGFEINLTPETEGAPEAGLLAYAVYTGSQKLGALKNADKTPVILSGAGKVTGVSGETSDNEIVEGSVTFAAGAAADVSGYEGIVTVAPPVD